MPIVPVAQLYSTDIWHITFFDFLLILHIPIVTSLQLLHTLILYFICRLLRKNELSFNEKDYYIISAILTTCMIMSVCFESIMLNQDENDWYLLLGMYSVVIFCVLLIVFFSSYHKRILNENKTKNELDILKSQISSNQKMIGIQKELYEMKHDIKHFIQTAKGFNKNNNKQIQVQINEFSDKYNNLSIPIQTTIPAFDHTLNITRDDAKQKGISLICNLNITKPLHADENDLYLLFSNIFDNAIEHIGLEKKINVYARNTDDLFALKVSNSTDNNSNLHNNIMTQEEAYYNHGYGLNTIKKIVIKYNGTMLYSCNNNMFEITVSLPI